MEGYKANGRAIKLSAMAMDDQSTKDSSSVVKRS